MCIRDRDEGVIDEDRAELLQSALDFGDVLAYEVITPRVDMLAVDIEDPWDEVLETAYDSPFSRIPVYADSIDNIIGILHLSLIHICALLWLPARDRHALAVHPRVPRCKNLRS